jgi:plasmid stabilization system protein ParE
VPPETYEVIFVQEARAEALEAADYIARFAPMNAARWYKGLEKAIRSLEILPGRFGLARESAYLGEELRQYIYKSYRIIYRVEESAKIVRVLHVRHAKRRAIGEPDKD